MNKFVKILELIRLHPTCYVPERRASLLEAYVDGFFHGFPSPGDRATPERETYNAFREWLDHLPRVKEMSPWFAEELMQLAGSDEAAFNEFYKLFDEFSKLHPESIYPSEDGDKPLSKC